MRRAPLVLTLEPLAPMALRSASRTSVKKWPRNSHCGTLRVPVTTGCCGAARSLARSPTLKMPVAPAGASKVRLRLRGGGLYRRGFIDDDRAHAA